MLKRALLLSVLYSATLLGEESTQHIHAEVCEQCGQSLSRAFIGVAKKCRPAVVHIRGEQGRLGNAKSYPFQGGPSSPFEQFQDELFQRFFGYPQQGSKNPSPPSQMSSGSGFIVSSDGYIVTNHHVVKDATRILVEKFDDVEQEFEAVIVGCDPNTDIAVLKIPGENLPFIEFADSDHIEVGQWTIAIGHPFRLRDSVTAGVISATNRGDLQISKLEDFIQTDTSINPGNSGGPLLDLSGKVIGVNTAILSRTGGSIGVGFAVPSNIAKMVFEQIRMNGIVDRAFLGVQIQDLNDDLCAGFRLKKGTAGALIAEVLPESSASVAGLEAGDIVIEFNGDVIKNAKQLNNSLQKLPAGSSCNLKVIRNGKPKKIQLMLGSRTKEISVEGDIIHKLGLVVEQITPENAHQLGVKTDDKGLVITRILPGSLAAAAGLHEGSVIMVVNGQKIASIGDLKKSLESANPKERLVMLMHNRGRASFYSIPHPLS